MTTITIATTINNKNIYNNIYNYIYILQYQRYYDQQQRR